MQVIFYLQLVEIKKYIYIHTWIDLHKLIRNSKTIFFPLPFSRLPCTTNALRKKGAQLVRQNDCSILHSFFYDVYIRFRGENRTLFSNIRYNEIIPSSIKVSVDFSKQSFPLEKKTFHHRCERVT